MAASSGKAGAKQKPSVLCVDDEPALLEGIAPHLRRHFEVTLASNGNEALELMKKSEQFDVVLSDMRMPGMNGAEFLAAARQAAPETVRILLTGQTDMETAIAAVNEGQIFRFLTKPCPTEKLVAAVRAGVEQFRRVKTEQLLLEQAAGPSTPATSGSLLEVNEGVSEEDRVKEIASQIIKIIHERIASDSLVLPAMPATALECMKLMRDPNQTFKTLAVVISRDPSLASRFLKVANSAANSGLSRASTVEDALARMGLDGIKSTVMQFSINQAFASRDERVRASFQGIWEHSLAVALLSKDLAHSLGSGGPNPGTTYLGGLFHDIGKPIVGSLMLEAKKSFEQSGKKELVREEIWPLVVAQSHRTIGVLLARKWGLPAEILKVILDGASYDNKAPLSSQNVVRLANALAKQAGLYTGAVDQNEVKETVSTGCTLIGVDPDMTAPFVSRARASLQTGG